MAHRETSTLSWEELKTSEQLTAARRFVYDGLCHYGPMTAGELTAVLKDETETRPSYHKRLSELLRQGVIEETRTRPCKVTGKECIEWKAIPGTPKPLKPGQSRSKKEKEVLEAARRYAHHPNAMSKATLTMAALRLRETE